VNKFAAVTVAAAVEAAAAALGTTSSTSSIPGYVLLIYAKTYVLSA